MAVWTSASAALSAVGKPLVVTPLLPHRYAEAQAASRVRLPGYNATDLFSGFFEIDAATSSRTFFLFSKAASGREDAPVLLWLNGGPGASSLIGFLTELGPFVITDDLDVVPRAVHWNLDAHLLTLDNPLGTGYSSTADDQRMATNQTTVGADLHAALEQFYTLFPELRANPFYATGESYAGKYIPAVAHTIHTRNAGLPPHRRINLRGLAIGDGAFDPPSQLIGFGPTLFALGMADARDVAVYEAYDARLLAALSAGRSEEAFRIFDEELNGDYFKATYYANSTGMGANYFNFATRPTLGLGAGESFPRWLGMPAVAAALHVGDAAYAVFNQSVETKLIGDWLVGVTGWLEDLLEHYNVLIYSGQNDIILGPPGTQRAMDKLRWSGAEAYATAPTRPMYMDPTDIASDLAGYVRQAVAGGGRMAGGGGVVGGSDSAEESTPRGDGRAAVGAGGATGVGAGGALAADAPPTLSYVVLRGCGHMVPQDQPERAYEMLRRFLVPMAPLPDRPRGRTALRAPPGAQSPLTQQPVSASTREQNGARLLPDAATAPAAAEGISAGVPRFS